MSDVNIVVIVNRRRMHQARHLALLLIQLFVIVVHGRFGQVARRLHNSVEKIAQPMDPVPAKDAEYLPLLVRKLGGRLAAEDRELGPEEGPDTRETQMGQTGAMVEQGMDTLNESAGTILWGVKTPAKEGGGTWDIPASSDAHSN